MKKLENILAENMRRFGTKNLNEQSVNWFDSIEPAEGDTVAIHGKSLVGAFSVIPRGEQEGVITLNGQGHTASMFVGAYSMKDAIRLKDDVSKGTEIMEFPSKSQAFEIAKKIKQFHAPNPGTIWIDQSKSLSSDELFTLNLNMYYVLFDLGSGSDVVGPNRADAVILVNRK